MVPLLQVHSLSAKAEKPILNGVTFEVLPGQIHVIMGPNGAGKSTLAHVLAGHPFYAVTSGEVLFCGNDLLSLLPEERAHRGLFLGFQYPIEVPGVDTFKFLRAAVQAKRKANGEEPFSQEAFESMLKSKMDMLQMRHEVKDRDVNTGFSGGEKKRNEILQLLLLEPKLAILDETDSGLDVDAMKVIAGGIQSFMTPEKSCILITHYERLLQYLTPDVVHIMVDGRIVFSGGKELMQRIIETGFEWARQL
jgi:Fe-S cluster assembly ATP-binding protein